MGRFGKHSYSRHADSSSGPAAPAEAKGEPKAYPTPSTSYAQAEEKSALAGAGGKRSTHAQDVTGRRAQKQKKRDKNREHERGRETEAEEMRKGEGATPREAAESAVEALPSQPTAGGGLPLYRQKGPRQAGGVEDDGVAPSKRSRGRDRGAKLDRMGLAPSGGGATEHEQEKEFKTPRDGVGAATRAGAAGSGAAAAPSNTHSMAAPPIGRRRKSREERAPDRGKDREERDFAVQRERERELQRERERQRETEIRELREFSSKLPQKMQLYNDEDEQQAEHPDRGLSRGGGGEGWQHEAPGPRDRERVMFDQAQFAQHQQHQAPQGLSSARYPPLEHLENAPQPDPSALQMAHRSHAPNMPSTPNSNFSLAKMRANTSHGVPKNSPAGIAQPEEKMAPVPSPVPLDISLAAPMIEHTEPERYLPQISQIPYLEDEGEVAELEETPCTISAVSQPVAAAPTVASPPPAGSPGALLPSDDVAAAAVVGEDEAEGEDDLVGDDEEIDEEEVDGEQGDGEDENGGENAQFRVSKFYVAPIPAFRS